MARRVGIRELRDNLTRLMRRVRAGESIEVTHDGEPIALISPLRRGQLERLIESGVVTPARRPLEVASLNPEPATGPMTASEALEEDRSAR